MKKVFVVCICVCCVIACASCKQSFRQYFFSYDSSAAAEVYIEEIIEAVKTGNEKQICDIYATNTLNEIGDITQSTKDFIDYIQGDIVSYGLLAIPPLESNVHGGKVDTSICCAFEIVTDEHTYYISSMICTRDDDDKNNVGIESMYIVDADDWLETRIYGKGYKGYIPGIHIDYGDETSPEVTTESENVVDVTVS